LIPSTKPASDQARVWIKLRANMEQELVIERVGSMRCSWELREQGIHLRGEGKERFAPRIRDELFPALGSLRTVKCPFANLPETRASRWGETITAEKMSECRRVKPKLVCQVAFLEWTKRGT
jgi:hypothetical protein